MSKHDSPLRAVHESQTDLSSDAGLHIFSYLLAGILGYGGLGWLIAHFTGWTWLVPVGILFGLGASLYIIIKRFGSGL